jgi:hypothetical protein
MRSVLIAIFELRADEVFVVAHHDCGMNNINPSKTIEKMVTRGGIKPESAYLWAALADARRQGDERGAAPQLWSRPHQPALLLTATSASPPPTPFPTARSARGAVVRGHRRQEVPARL